MHFLYNVKYAIVLFIKLTIYLNFWGQLLKLGTGSGLNFFVILPSFITIIYVLESIFPDRLVNEVICTYTL